jgi:hypothetical protein
MKNIRRLFATLSAAAVMSGVLGAPTVHAGAHVFPATLCEIRSGDVPFFTQTGELQNAGTTQLAATCPVVRDNTTGKWTSIQAKVEDRHNGAGVSCRAISTFADGTLLDIAGTVASSNSFIGRTTLTLPLPNEADNGSLVLDCRVPPQSPNGISSVSNYRFVEP